MLSWEAASTRPGDSEEGCQGRLQYFRMTPGVAVRGLSCSHRAKRFSFCVLAGSVIIRDTHQSNTPGVSPHSGGSPRSWGHSTKWGTLVMIHSVQFHVVPNSRTTEPSTYPETHI